MNIETPKKKKSFLATKISGFNSFLFWFGKKVYSFLLGLIFIIFIGAGVYAFFAGGESISAPSFEDDIYEDEKNARMEILKEKEKYEKLSQEEIKEIIKVQNDLKKLIKGGYVGKPPVTSGLIEISDEHNEEENNSEKDKI